MREREREKKKKERGGSEGSTQMEWRKGEEVRSERGRRRCMEMGSRMRSCDFYLGACA